jgi:hypothetical protein
MYSIEAVLELTITANVISVQFITSYRDWEGDCTVS